MTMADVRRRLFKLIDATPNLDWLLLTKRIENVKRLWPSLLARNIWLGTSVENQAAAEERIPILLQIPASIRFLSCEPLLEAIDMHPWIDCTCNEISGTCINCQGGGIHWMIVGGESGPGARPMDVAWARSIVRQCKDRGVACFVKQLGKHPIQIDRVNTASGVRGNPEGVRLTDKKGGDPAEWPEDLRVREFPTVAHGRTS
jgi:protein gp37